MKRKFWNWVKNGAEEERTLILNGEISDETWYGDEVTPKLFEKELNSGECFPYRASGAGEAESSIGAVTGRERGIGEI